jgi:uncharacterized protein
MANATLQLPLVGLPAGHSTYRGRLEFVGLDAAEEEEPYDVGVDCELDNLGTRIHVRCDIRGAAQSTCHRCLRRFARDVAAGFEITLERGAGSEGDDQIGVPENASEYDLTPHVQEAVLLEQPIRALCEGGCKGLCPQCGADWNQGPCGCAPAPDPRWAQLDRLRGQL